MALFICKLLQEGNPTLAEAPSHGWAAFTPTGCALTKNVEKGLVSLFLSLKQSLMYCAFQSSSLLFGFIFNHATSLFVIIINTSNALLIRNRRRLPASEISSVWGCANSLQLRHTPIQSPPSQLYEEKALFLTVPCFEAYKYMYVYTHLYIIYTHTHKSCYLVKKCQCLFQSVICLEN